MPTGHCSLDASQGISSYNIGPSEVYVFTLCVVAEQSADGQQLGYSIHKLLMGEPESKIIIFL